MGVRLMTQVNYFSKVYTLLINIVNLSYLKCADFKIRNWNGCCLYTHTNISGGSYEIFAKMKSRHYIKIGSHFCMEWAEWGVICTVVATLAADQYQPVLHGFYISKASFLPSLMCASKHVLLVAAW